MTAVQVAEKARSAGIRLVRFLYCDNDGVIRGKCSGIADLETRLERGIGLTLAMQAFTMLDHLAPYEGMGPVGEIRLVPDPSTFVIAPYAPHTGAVLVDMVTLEGQPYPADGRDFLKRMVARAAGERDLHMLAAFEPEWTLSTRADGVYQPLDESGCFTSTGMNTAAGVIDEIVEALEAQGMEVEQYYPELGWGQQELSIKHAPALAAADRHIHYKETVRGIALRHGLFALFAPKPWVDQAGNGCHLHFSGWSKDGTANRFYDQTQAYGLSTLARQFMAGLLDHLPALVALTCASVNSYRRLQPQTWASAYRVWGPDNREGALRVASPTRSREAQSANVELKASDSSSNPYLALGGVIAAGLDGIERGLELPPPATTDPHLLSDDERRMIHADRLPQSLEEAVGNLRRDQVLIDALGDRLAGSYMAVKEADIAAFASEDQAFELRQHAYKF
ncbi:MAG: glutamine synthetase [Actinobacteria bacterium 13_1_20CM_2_65_11]|nr:MAG: glutamine synthetase [Chloroflexi bacterium 13_1_40CM_65_17]OLC65011.1 MAG: glutamine synthetase [Actinobacteria bacterium 13_1_40CM_4_65_12]OLD25980.1 MAG: glutamine synthetase [Chloroflexi bacterium 13_1_40CM_3_65_12]OLE80520.1 MAG: glutamine synthetase [Actinobacteria bacterium 13_1_20CM_2_65_11]